jgi:MSHA pilin protein MshD
MVREARSISRRFARGFTLLECLVASALLAFTVAALTQAVTAGQWTTLLGLRALRATALAEALMEEVLSKPYNDPNGASTAGPESGETSRSLYDNADDYHGFTETAGNLKDAAGTAYPADYQVFSRSVTAAYGSQTVTGLGSAISGLTISVTVTDGKGGSWSVTRFLSDPS